MDPDTLSASRPLLRVNQLLVEFRVEERAVEAVKGISFGVRGGETLMVVGEPGSGKSATALDPKIEQR